MTDELALNIRPMQAVIERVYDTVLDFEPQLALGDLDTVDNLLQTYQTAEYAETGFVHVQAIVLALFKKHWDNLPLSFRQQYGYTFEYFAQALTRKEPSTLNNYVRTANAWFLDAPELPSTIDVPTRATDGRKIIKEGKLITHPVVFNPLDTSMSKLLIVTARFTAGQMTPDLWEKLADPFVTVSELRSAHMGDKENEDFEPYFSLEGPLVVYTEGPYATVVAELVEDEGPQAERAVAAFLLRLGIVEDGAKIFTLVKRGNAV